LAPPPAAASFVSLSVLDEPRLLLWPQTEGVPIPDPTPETP
jgi:hypothetical protein